MAPRLREQGLVQLVLDLKRKKKNKKLFSCSLCAYQLESCMVAKKLVKCKEQQKKGDGGWKG